MELYMSNSNTIMIGRFSFDSLVIQFNNITIINIIHVMIPNIPFCTPSAITCECSTNT